MSGLKETVTDEVADQVDAGDVVSSEAITDQLDGAKLGRAVGEAVGASLGRRAGDLLFGRLLSKLGIGDGEQSTRTGRVLSAVGVALARTLSKPQFRDPLESAVRDLVASREAAGEESDAEEGAGEEAEGEESAGEEAEGEEGEGDEGSAPEIDAETLQSLKRDTYRDLLDRMDYSELQSLAKDAGVKANLKRDDLVDALVEEFGDDSEGGEEDDESADEEGADESAEEGDGSDEDADEE